MNPTRWVNRDPWCLRLCLAGGVLAVAGAALVVSISLGESATVRSGTDGSVVTESHHTQSILQQSPLLALLWIVIAVMVSALFTLAIRYGASVGPVIVSVIAGLGLLTAMLSVGIFFAPAIALFCAAALLAIINRWGSRVDSRG